MEREVVKEDVLKPERSLQYQYSQKLQVGNLHFGNIKGNFMISEQLPIKTEFFLWSWLIDR